MCASVGDRTWTLITRPCHLRHRSHRHREWRWHWITVADNRRARVASFLHEADAAFDPVAASTLAIYARDALVEAGQDLVGNGTCRLRNRLDGDHGFVLPADQHDLVFIPGTVMADIDHELVHADATDDRVAPAADQHFAA